VKHVPLTKIQQRHTKFNHENAIIITSQHLKICYYILNLITNSALKILFIFRYIQPLGD